MKNKTLLAVALVAALGFTTCSVFAEELDTKPKSHENTEVLLGKNQTQYVSRGGSGMIYYTYSPIQGTYYYVVNI